MPIAGLGFAELEAWPAGLRLEFYLATIELSRKRDFRDFCFDFDSKCANKTRQYSQYRDPEGPNSKNLSKINAGGEA